MAAWREIFGIDGEVVDFERVHMCYREKLLTLPPAEEIEYLNMLNFALEAARQELATQGRAAKRS